MNSGHSLEKKENLSEKELELGEDSAEIAANQGDRWTFVGVVPDSSFIHTLHHGDRNLEEATEFIGEIKTKSDGEAPLFSSDNWFYEQALLTHYGGEWHPPYAGRGRRPHPVRVPLEDLKYVQVQKKRDAKGRLREIHYNVVYGNLRDIEQVYQDAQRCKTINTVYVESRNGKFRKDNSRLIRRTLCHSKKYILHDAQINFTAQVMNYTRTNDGLKVLINPDAGRFEQKYQHQTPAMAQKLIDKPLTIKELLFRRPQTIP
jgi:hypothetical protein